MGRIGELDGAHVCALLISTSTSAKNLLNFDKSWLRLYLCEFELALGLSERIPPGGFWDGLQGTGFKG